MFSHHPIPRSWLLTLAMGLAACGAQSPTAPSPSADSPTPTPVNPVPRPPPPRVTLAGVVSEVSGGPIAGALIQTADGSASTVTNASGSYRLADFLSQPLIVSREGYESHDIPAYLSSNDRVNARLQRTITMTVGQTLTSSLLRDDPIYGAGLPGSGPGCQCKRIRIETAQSGTLEVTVSTPEPLSVWVGNSSTSYPTNQPLLVTVAAAEVLLSVGVDWFDGPDVSADAPFQVSVQSSKLKPLD